jgi:peptide-methionine (S)-S-oxide reductase
VLVVYDECVVSLMSLLKMFWESHDPTQGMRQGNDLGTQYRSAIYTFDEDQAAVAQASAGLFQQALTAVGYGPITTEVQMSGPFYYAEHYHQQYLAKVPNGYCGLNGTGVGCDISALAQLEVASS